MNCTDVGLDDRQKLRDTGKHFSRKMFARATQSQPFSFGRGLYITVRVIVRSFSAGAIPAACHGVTHRTRQRHLVR